MELRAWRVSRGAARVQCPRDPYTGRHKATRALTVLLCMCLVCVRPDCALTVLCCGFVYAGSTSSNMANWFSLSEKTEMGVSESDERKWYS